MDYSPTGLRILAGGGSNSPRNAKEQLRDALALDP